MKKRERICWVVLAMSLFVLWRLAAAEAIEANAWADALETEVNAVMMEIAENR